jgi:hypothetical protein
VRASGNTMSKNPDLLAVVVSPNTAYRLALVQVLQDQRGISIGAEGESLAQVMAENPGLQPALTVVDAKIADSISEARRAWPDTWIIYLLDYLSDWETATARGASVSSKNREFLPSSIGFWTSLTPNRRQTKHGRPKKWSAVSKPLSAENAENN